MNYIFDFDGTLVDSLPWGLKIINRYLKKYPRIFPSQPKLNAEQFRSKGSMQLLREFNISGLKLYFLIFLARKEIDTYKDKMKTFKGINKELKNLSKYNHLFIVTSNSKKHTQYVLNKNSVAKYFDDIYSSIAYFGKHKKLLKLIKNQKLDPARTIYIGDETRDMQAAKKAGIKTIAVTWGYENKKIISKSKPDRIITKPEDLFSSIEQYSQLQLQTLQPSTHKHISQ